jgi:uncharacterized protein YneF (UPF0154 family)
MMVILFLLQPMDAMGKPGLLLLILPVLVIFGILAGVYTARQRMRRRSTERPS